MIANPQPNDPVNRHIRSFIRRDSRLTSGQQHAIDSGWEKYGLNLSDQILDLNSVFTNSAPVILEIGFGNGESLAKMASNNPHYNFIGIETHKPGVGHLLIELEQRDLNNVRVYNADVISVLSDNIKDRSINGIHIFFPDPWQKRRHNKRRLINQAFIQKLTNKLCTNGYLFIATDWLDYAKSIDKILNAENSLMQIQQREQTNINIPNRPLTKFESRGIKLGHIINEFKYFKQQ